ncbi:MAG: 3-phosphoshikimate 1-carboxyvinyltransferase [Bacteroidetes bacterium]|nr:MAG: 3-phosphoshikimate 1-carboxyvinyltransferase [Bacteroidota bacterium]
MSKLLIKHLTKHINGTIVLPASKSINNRLLVLQQLIGAPKFIEQSSTSEDTRLMERALAQGNGTIHVNHAGTCLRFLTAYFACTPGCEVILKGSERLHQRPMETLVNALKQLGAEITYVNKEGFAPLHIKGKKLHGGTVYMDASVSSQFVSALMLIAPVLTGELTIKQLGKVVSKPYVRMTAALLQKVGVTCTIEQDVVVKPFVKALDDKLAISVERDWSGAGFWFAMAALATQCNLQLSNLSMQSIQGDKIVASFMESFGVSYTATNQGILLKRQQTILSEAYFDMLDCPDLVPPMAVAMCGLNIPAVFTNVANLQVKESKRLTALCNELNQCGFKVSHTENDLVIEPVNQQQVNMPDFFNTYNDHRMAMSFAILALKLGAVVIKDAHVVEKSYPGFWNDLKLAGFEVETIED